MNATLLTVSNERFKESRDRLVDSARRHGIASILSIDFDSIREDEFYRNNARILSQARGMGFWLWKPFFISKALHELEANDILIYVDAGAEIIENISPLINLCREKEPVLLFGNGADTNARWTKRDAFVLTDCDKPEFWNGPHCDASIILFRKNETSMTFVSEWIGFCQKPEIITDAPNTAGLPNLDAFEDHRHDQSVLSLVAQRRKVDLHRIPSQYGNHYKSYRLRVDGEFNCASQWDLLPLSHYAAIPYQNSEYGQLINHHRKQIPVPAKPPDRSFRSIPKRAIGKLQRAKDRVLSRPKT